MSRGNKDSFPDRLKRWLKLDHGGVFPSQRIFLTEELSLELDKASPIPIRMKAIKELNELLSMRMLEEFGTERVWCLVNDLLSDTCAAEQRHSTLQMLTTLATTHEDLGLMRQVFFQHISKNYKREEIEHIFGFFCAVIGNGKKVEHIEESVGTFLLEWLPAVLEMPQAVDGLNLLNNLVKFNSALLDERVVVGFVMVVLKRLQHATGEEEAVLCLHILESIIAYSNLPFSTLPNVIYALTRLVNVPQITQLIHKVVIKLFGTHHGRNGLNLLCQMIRNMVDPHMVRGAIFFLSSVLWGNTRISSLDCSPAVVLPIFYKVSENDNVLVVFEMALSIQKLLSVKAHDIFLSSWTQLLGTLANVFMHTVCLQDGKDKGMILSVLSDIMDYIEDLVDNKKFYGSVEEFYLLVATYAQQRPEDSVLRMMDYQANNTLPEDPHWLTKLGTLLSLHYRRDPRLVIKMKALDILLEVFICYRHQHGIELVRDVVMIQLDGVEREAKVQIRTAAVKLLIKIVLMLQSDIILKVLGMLEKIVLAPYRRGGNSGVPECEAADIVIAVDSLISAFKVKMWELPSTYAICIFKILLSCLEHHYQNKILLEKTVTIRFLILEMILEMRINSKYQIGFARNEGCDVRNDPYVISSFSPFLILDHVHRKRVSETPEMHTTVLELSPSGSADLLSREGDEKDEDLEEESQQAGEAETTCEESQQAGEAETACEESEATTVLFTRATTLLIISLQKEKDWVIVRLILEKLVIALQNKILVLSRSRNEIVRLISALISMVDDKSLDLPTALYNTPAKFYISRFQSYIFPVLSKLVPHHMHFEYSIQRKVIRCLSVGVINQYSGPLCISSITMCVLEMQDSMLKVLTGIMHSFSRMSATVTRSRAMMEFLSTLLHFPKVYSNFVANQYKLIFAIALPYTNPAKFNHYIVSLAYRVIAMWFLKCRLPYRRSSIDFITKNLNTILRNVTTMEVKSSKDSKQTKVKGKKSTQVMADTDEEIKHKNMVEFFSDLRETCLDHMSRYTYGTCPPFQSRSCVDDMLISGGQSQSWLIGNKIITISTSGCEQRIVKNGLCEKCLQKCSAQNTLDSANLARGSTDNSGLESSPVDLSESSVMQPLSSRSNLPTSSLDELPSEQSGLVSISSPRSSSCQSESSQPFEHAPDYSILNVSVFGSPVSDRPHSGSASDIFPTSSVDQEAKNKSGQMPLTSTSEGSISERLEPEEPAGDGQSHSSDHSVFSQSEETPQSSSSQNEDAKPHLCACWCQGWVEIVINQPTGNMCLMMHIQNRPAVSDTDIELPLRDLSEIITPAYVKDKKKSSRRSSISGSPSNDTSSTGKDVEVSSVPAQRPRGYTVSEMNPATRRKPASNSSASKGRETIPGLLTPGFVFLQLYFHGHLEKVEDRPLLLPTDQVEIQRALRVINLITPHETHKIGVLYARRGQTTEQDILSNTFGSFRYMQCVMGMGHAVELKGVSTKEIFLGGLDTNGSDGELAYVWHDDVMQVVFHVATLMPTLESDPNCNGKKRHIGNNYVTIVYNESGEPYNINTMKGQFNHTVIEVVPCDHASNRVSVLSRPELDEYVRIDNPRIVSDSSLPILVRQLALHANFASKVFESLSRPPYTPFASNWIERLRKIRKLRETVLQEIRLCDQGHSPLELLDFTDMIDASVRRRTGIDRYAAHFMY